MRNQIFTVSAAPKNLQVHAESRRALFVTGGVHTIYDGHVRLAKEGQIQAQEVLATGTAKLRLHGHIMAKLFGEASAKAGNQRAGSKAYLELRHASSLDIIEGSVDVYDQSRVDALESRIFVISGTPTIVARACIVVIYPGANPVLDIDTHTTVFRCPGAEETTPRAFAVAEAGAAV